MKFEISNSQQQLLLEILRRHNEGLLFDLNQAKAEKRTTTEEWLGVRIDRVNNLILKLKEGIENEENA